MSAPRDIPLSDLADLCPQEIGVSDWHEVSQAQIDAFAKATGDFQWMHVDVKRATQEMGGTIAHGLMTLALLPALSEQIYHVSGYSSGYSYGYDKVRFTRPLKSGSQVRLRLSLAEVARKGAGTMVTVTCVMEIQGEAVPALVTNWRSLYFPPA